LAVFPGGKYLQRKALDNVSQVVKELALELRSHDFALSFKEKGKSLKWMTSFETAFILIVSHFFKKDEICVLEFSKGDPPNCSCWKSVMSPRLNWKLFASMGGLTMLEGTELGPGIAKPRKGVVSGYIMLLDL